MASRNQKCPTRSSHVSWSQLGDGVVVYNPVSKHYYILEGAAARMWQLADGSTMEERIGEALVAEFEIAKEEALKDVRETLEGLAEFGLLK